MTEPAESNRREFLTGRALQKKIEEAGENLLNELDQQPGRETPTAGDTVRLGTRAMACEFVAIMDPSPGNQVLAASDALELIHALEQQLTVYRSDSELSVINDTAHQYPVIVEERLFELLQQTVDINRATAGGFDATAGPLITLWRNCREENRIPTEDEIAECLNRTGVNHLSFDAKNRTVSYDSESVELNLGGIGKGYALDRAGEHLRNEGVENFLFHGGYSSILAVGRHQNLEGWPVGILNPAFRNSRLATILLKDQAISTSGSSVQFFRHAGQRYGHILDPRTGWPVQNMLSVTVVAPTAALADALSTAFFVSGVENAREYCDNAPNVGALLIPPPKRGRKLDIVNCGIPEEALFFTPDGESK